MIRHHLLVVCLMNFFANGWVALDKNASSSQRVLQRRALPRASQLSFEGLLQVISYYYPTSREETLRKAIQRVLQCAVRWP